MARRVTRRACLAGLTFGAAGVATGAAGCDVITGGCGDELSDEPAVTYSAGTSRGGIYRSSSWDAADWIDYPPGISLRFEHKLGMEPRAWQAYVATSRTGDDGSRLVLATGNDVELVAIDDQAVTVRNGTCVDFFIVMVVMSSVPA